MRYLALPLLLIAAPAIAQSEKDILVQSNKPTEESRAEARSYVRATGVAWGVKPVARWASPICPKVIGLSGAHAARVERRIRKLALDAKAETAPAGCDANVVVSFVVDAPGVARKIRAKEPRRLAELDAGQKDALTTGEAPIRWWYQTGVRGSDGNMAIADSPPGFGGGEGGISPLNVGGGAIRPPTPSLISTHVARALEAATVLVDVDRATGKTLDDVADYAAFVALAEMRPADPVPAGSVLGLFQNGSGLTDNDRRLMAALYRIPLDRHARRHRGMLAVMVDPASAPADLQRAEQDEGVDETE